MLINLPYPPKSKSWNFRFFTFLALLALLSLFFSAKQSRASRPSRDLQAAPLSAARSGEFKVLTYNVAGLPQLISSAKTPRARSIRQIGQNIDAFDIVNVQEDFNYNDELYQLNNHPYRSESMGGVPFGDGLSTLSRFPIVEMKRVAWTHCSGSDCLTPKGFSYTRIQLAKDAFIDLYNIHATAQDNPSAVEARKQNLQQFASFLQEQSACQAVLIMGDFNAHYAFAEDHVRSFHQHSGMLDAWVILNNQGLLPAFQPDFKARHALQVHENCESIDKIYFRNSDKLSFVPKDYKVEKERFQDEHGAALSDHCAISMAFDWQLHEAASPAIN